MTTDKSEMQVKSIKDGTVIDHIPSDKLFQVVSILHLDEVENEVTIGNHLASRLMGTKGIIKIAGRFFREDELNKIALAAPESKVNLIRDYEVVEKRVVCLPDRFKGVVRCANPKCITNNEPMESEYVVVSRRPLRLKCVYCEKEMLADELKLL